MTTETKNAAQLDDGHYEIVVRIHDGSENEPQATLARYEPEAVYIGAGDYVAECVRVDDGDYYLAADVDAAIEALQAEIDALRTRLENTVRDSTNKIEALRAEVSEVAKVLRGALDASTDGEPLRVLAIRASNALYWRTERAERAEARAERLAEALRRYRNEVPLGHQPHMLAHEVDDLLRDQTRGKAGQEVVR